MTAAGLLQIGEIYLYIGAAVAALFLVLGIERIEPNARGAYAFRALIVPGLILVWPLVLWRWYALALGDEGVEERHRPPHRLQTALALLLALGAPLLLITALALKPDWPAGVEPVLLEAPA
ncbi:MAG: hypothetical protein AAF416_05695 [Pseudomonadota bacterium]